jgi:hypothetical protein
VAGHKVSSPLVHPPSTRPSRPLRTMAKDYRRLWEDITSTSDEGKAVRTLAEIVLDEEGRSFISNLQRKDAELCIEVLDLVSRDPYLLPSPRLRWFRQSLAEHNLKTAEKQAFFVTLRRLAAIHGRLPTSMMIAEVKISNKLLGSGGFADVKTGTYMEHPVAVKIMKVTEQDDLLVIRKASANDTFYSTRDVVLTVLFQRFCKEVVLWNTLSHPNVLKLFGVHGDMGKGEFITVSEWMVHGNIMQYIGNNHVNRLELVRGFTAPAATSFTKMSQ